MKDHMSLAPDHSNTRASTAGSSPTGSSLNSAYREMLEAPVMAVSFGTVVGVTLIYSITGPLGIEDTLAVGQRLLYLGLCAFICWPVCHSLSTTILYVMRHRTPYQILLAAVACAAFIAIPCSAVAYTVFGVAGQSLTGRFADIYLNTSLALAACSTVVHYAACLRARLSVAALAASAAVRAINRDASSRNPRNRLTSLNQATSAGRATSRKPPHLRHQSIPTDHRNSGREREAFHIPGQDARESGT